MYFIHVTFCVLNKECKASCMVILNFTSPLTKSWEDVNIIVNLLHLVTSLFANQKTLTCLLSVFSKSKPDSSHVHCFNICLAKHSTTNNILLYCIYILSIFQTFCPQKSSNNTINFTLSFLLHPDVVEMSANVFTPNFLCPG